MGVYGKKEHTDLSKIGVDVGYDANFDAKSAGRLTPTHFVAITYGWFVRKPRWKLETNPIRCRQLRSNGTSCFC